jgi:TonB family protein
MGDVSTRSGIFYFKETGLIGPFPRDLRRGLMSRIDPRFAMIFFSLFLVGTVTVGLLSRVKLKVETYSEKEILKIQERYAQLVLNQPKPKVEEPTEKADKAKVDKAGAQKKAEVKKEEVKVDREKESFVQREQRREETRATREQVRKQVTKQVMSAGIFAAITATSSGPGKGGGQQVTDLLGAATAGLDIGTMNVSKGSFATKNVDVATLAARKGERVANVGIQKQDVGRAAVTQVATAGSVNITTQAPQISGEAANIAERSQTAIARVVTRESQRLKRVYEDWLKRDPQLAGRLKVKFSIMPDGSVSNVVIVESTTNNADFDDAILRYIKRWQFAPAGSGGPVEVVYPFAFEGQA